MEAVPLRAAARTIVALACAAAVSAQAQPVRLRLANSLCTSMTAQVLTSQHVPPLASTATPEASVHAALTERVAQQREAFFGRLDALVPFSGLYVTGTADRSFADSAGGRYSFGLEWELFDQGRAEARRQLDRSRLESKLQYLQLQRDLHERRLQESLLAVDQMRNKLHALLYEREAAAARRVLERRRQALAAGSLTRADVAEAEYKAERAALRSGHHAGGRDVLVYPQAQDLINRIETVRLQPDGRLLEHALSRSPEAQLQALLLRRSEFLPSARDNTSVRFYLERAKDFERGPYNVAGVRLRVPLGDDDAARDALADASRAMGEDQQASLRAALAQKLALLGERLRLKQNDMRLLQAENRMVRQKAELACYRLDHPVAALPGDAEREVEELTLRLHELQREILTARLDVLEALTQVSALVQPREPQELYTLEDPR